MVALTPEQIKARIEKAEHSDSKNIIEKVEQFIEGEEAKVVSLLEKVQFWKNDEQK